MKTVGIMVLLITVLGFWQPVMAAGWPEDLPLPSQVITSTRQEIQNIVNKFGLKNASTVNQKPNDSLQIYKSRSGIEMDIFFRRNGIEVVYVFPPTFSVNDLVAIRGYGKYPFRLSETEYFGTGKNLEWRAQVWKPRFGHASRYIQILGVAKKYQ